MPCCKDFHQWCPEREYDHIHQVVSPHLYRGNRQTQGAGTCRWGHLAMMCVCGLWKLHGLLCRFVDVLLTLFGSEARMHSLWGGRKPLWTMITGVPLGASFQGIQFLCIVFRPQILAEIIFIDECVLDHCWICILKMMMVMRLKSWRWGDGMWDCVQLCIREPEKFIFVSAELSDC